MTAITSQGGGTGDDTAQGCYVYGVVSAGDALPADLAGVASAPVRLVTAGGVAAVVSDVHLDGYVGRRDDLLAHSEVLDTLAVTMVVVPVQFGSMMPDDVSVIEEVLLPQREMFLSYLEELSGRAQFNLRATYHQGAVLTEVVQTDPEIADLRRRTRNLPEDEGYALRIRLGELVAKALEQKRAYDEASLLEVVTPFVAAHVQRAGGGIEHVTDLALLVDDDRRTEFEQQMESLAEVVHERMRLRLVGPMAAYDFVEA